MENDGTLQLAPAVNASETFRARILLVDDEPSVLKILARNLRGKGGCDVVTAEDGHAALNILAQGDPFAVIVSDMWMPKMHGVHFLAKARQLSPDTVRILLTGRMEINVAIAAINDGEIFRFLTKPCLQSTFVTAIDAAIEQYRGITTLRALLEQTLRGAIKTLADVLELSNAVAFGRAMRVKQHVADLAEKLGLTDRSQFELAALLSQLGCITLPPHVAEKAYGGRPLTAQEEDMLARVPLATEQLLGNIPRLETVRAILASWPTAIPMAKEPCTEQEQIIINGAQLLLIATDFDLLVSADSSATAAISTMRGREGRYASVFLDAFAELRAIDGPSEGVQEIMWRDLRPGMVLAEDAKSMKGTVVASRGYEVTATFLARCATFHEDPLRSPMRIVFKRPNVNCDLIASYLLLLPLNRPRSRTIPRPAIR